MLGAGGSREGWAPWRGGSHSQAVCGLGQHLHRLVQHPEATLPVLEVSMAMEEQAVERSAQRQVLLGPCGRRQGSGVQGGPSTPGLIPG